MESQTAWFKIVCMNYYNSSAINMHDCSMLVFFFLPKWEEALFRQSNNIITSSTQILHQSKNVVVVYLF